MLVFIDDNVAEEIKVVSAEEEFFDKNSVAETKIDILRTNTIRDNTSQTDTSRIDTSLQLALWNSDGRI